MNALKERILGAVTVMDDRDMARLWGIIEDEFGNNDAEWGTIPEEAPDEIDLRMLKEIEEDSDCREFMPASEAEKILKVS